MHLQLAAHDGRRGTAAQTLAVDRVGIDTVLALVVVVAKAIHGVDDGRGLLLVPHVDALGRVRLAGEQRGRVHAVGVEVVLPGYVGAARWHLHGGVGELVGRRGCAGHELVGCCCGGGHGGLEAGAAVGRDLKGYDAALGVLEGAGTEVEAGRHCDLHGLVGALQARGVLQAERPLGERGGLGLRVGAWRWARLLAALLGEAHVVEAYDLGRAVACVLGHEADGDGRGAVGLKVHLHLLPGLLVLERGALLQCAALGLQGDVGVAAEAALPECHCERISALGQAHCLRERLCGRAPVLAYPVGLLAAVGRLCQRGEEVAVVEVAGAQGREVVLVGRGALHLPALGHVDGTVSAHAAAGLHAVSTLKVAVDDVCGQLHLLIVETLALAYLLACEADVIDLQLADGAAEVLVVVLVGGVPPLRAAHVVARVGSQLGQHVGLVLVGSAAGGLLTVDVDACGLAGGIEGDGQGIVSGGTELRG